MGQTQLDAVLFRAAILYPGNRLVQYIRLKSRRCAGLVKSDVHQTDLSMQQMYGG